MAIADVRRPSTSTGNPPPSLTQSAVRWTAGLKIVPESKPLRKSIATECTALAAGLDKTHPPTMGELETLSRQLLTRMGHPDGYLVWTTVALTSAFWRDQVAAVPHERRLLLAPVNLQHTKTCPLDGVGVENRSQECCACRIENYRATAEKYGCRVLPVEDISAALRFIVGGQVDAIVGVARLNLLEGALCKLVPAGIPCMAVPLNDNNGTIHSFDENLGREMIGLEHETAAVRSRSYIHLMRAAANLFEPDKLARLLSRQPRRTSQNGRVKLGEQDFLEPLSGTEDIAFDFLTKGGKYSRPFITMAVHDALTGGRGTMADGAEYLRKLPESTQRVAVSIETFHKASLVHDDIEDDDGFRYGDQTLHRKYGVPTAINVGDYLIGLGYRLVSRESEELGADVVSDLIDKLAEAHMRLSEGQGAELLWRDLRDKKLTPAEALNIYTLKTAPAFEVALFMGMRLAGVAEQYAEFIPQFARNLGVAFQIINDLKDWSESAANKVAAGGDVLGGRPTVLWAMALDVLPPQKRAELFSLVRPAERDDSALGRVRELYLEAGVFAEAHRLVEVHQREAESLARGLEPEELRRLLYYLIDTVLDTSVMDGSLAANSGSRE